MKKGYATIKKFYRTYEDEIAVLAVAATYMSMLLANLFWLFRFENADWKDIAACRAWDRTASIQADILWLMTTIILTLVFCYRLFLRKQKHIQGDEILTGRKKTWNSFRTYGKEFASAYGLSCSLVILVMFYMRYQFLGAETEIKDLTAYRQFTFDFHVRRFWVCNIVFFLSVFLNFALMVKVRRKENIIKILLKMKKGGMETK